MYGKTQSKESKEIMSEAKKGNTIRKGLTKETDESIARMAEKLRRPKKRVSCPNCGKIGAVGLMKRYHFDNCKQLN